MNRVVINIPNPNLLSYIIKRFNGENNEITVTRYDSLGKIITSCTQTSKYPVKQSGNLIMNIPRGKKKNNHRKFEYIPEMYHHYLIACFQKEFDDEFSGFIKYATYELNLKFKQAIQIYMLAYDLDQNFYEALKKNDYRERVKSKNTRKKVAELIVYQTIK